MSTSPNIGIYLTAKLSPASIEQINAQLKTLGAKPINLKVNVDKNGIQNVTKQTKKYGKTVDANTKKVKNFSTQHNRMAEGGMSVWKQFGVAMQRIPIWMAGMTAFYAPLRSFQEGLQGVRDIDQQLIELAKVTDENTYNLEQMRVKALEMGSALGTVADKVLKATVEFSRLGYELDEASKLAEESIIFGTVGNFPVEKATKSLISVMKAYRLEVDEARGAIDSINQVGNEYAISQEDIAEILRRSSSAMREANNSLEQTIALGTGAQEIVQNARMVGTSLRTVSMRIRGVSEEGDDLSDLVPQLEQSFGRLGLTLKKDDETFLSTYEIMKQLAGVWDEISDMERANILELIAGKRQGQQISALLSNWESVESALDTAQNASGSAEREFARATESINFKMNQMANNMQRFWSNVIDSEAVRGFADGLVGLSTGMANFAENIDAGRFAINGILTAIMLLIVKKTHLMTTMAGLSGYTKIAIAEMGVLKGTMFSLGTAVSALNLKAIALKVTLTALKVAVTFGLSYAITGLISLFMNYNQSMEETIENQKQMVYEAESNIKNIESEQNTVAELVKVLDDSNSSHEELIDAKERLADIFPSITAGYNSETGEIIINNDELERQIALQEKKLEIEKQAMSRSAGSVIYGNQSIIEMERTELERLEEKYKDLIREREMLEDNLSKYSPDDIQYTHISKALDRLNPKIAETSVLIRESQNEIIEAQQGIAQAYQYITADTEGLTEHQIGFFDTVTTMFQNMNMNASQYRQATSGLVEIVESFGGSAVRHREAIVALANENGLLKTRGDYERLMRAIEDYDKSVDKARRGENGLNIEMAHTKEELEVLNREYTQSTDKIIDLNKMLQELNSTEGMSAETKNRLIKKYPELNHLIGNEIELTEQIKNLILEEEEVQRTAFFNKIKYSEDFLNSRVEGENTLREKLAKAYGVDLSNANTLAQAKLKIEQKLINEMTRGWSRYFNARGEMVWSEITYLQGEIADAIGSGQHDLAGELMDNYNQIQKVGNALDVQLNSIEGVALDLAGIDFTPINLSGLSDPQKRDPSGGSNDLARAQEAELRERERYADDVISLIKDLYSKQLEIAVNTIEREMELLEKAHEDKIDLIEDEIEKVTKRSEQRIKLLNDELEAERETHEGRMEGYDDELESFQELANAKIKELQREQQSDNFSRNLSDAESERNEILAEIDKYSMDDSIEGRKRVHELRERLAESETNIERMKEDRQNTLRQESLRDQIDRFRQEIEDKKENERQQFEATETRINNEISAEERKTQRIIAEKQRQIEAEQRRHKQEIEAKEEEVRKTQWKYDILMNDEAKYAQMRTNIINGNMTEVNRLLQGFSDDFKGYNEDSLYEIDSSYQEVQNLIGRINEAQKGFSRELDTTTTNSLNGVEKLGNGISRNIGRTFDTLGREVNGVKNDINDALDDIDDNIYNIKSNIKSLERNYRGVEELSSDGGSYHTAYNTGGVIDYTGLAQVDGSKKQPEVVFNAQDAKKLYEYVRNIPEFGRVASKMDRNIGRRINEIIIDIDIDRVIGDEQSGRNLGSGIVDGLKRRGVALTNE